MTLAGTVIGRCRVIEKLGEGTLSEVFRAAQEGLPREVAVKVLKASVAPGSQLGQRFGREATLLAPMNHQNLPQVYDAGEWEGRSFIVLELIEGLSLSQLQKRTGPLPSEVATIVALKLARALEYVHLRGIVHRDVKPSNVLVSRRGEVKLMDFGIARDLGDPPQDGLGVVGTPAYMSPEQVLGDRLDFRSDVFSFGIVLYEMLTGRRPFEEEPARTVMQKIRLDRYAPARSVVRGVPATLDRILGRCLEKNPTHRYPSTGALCDDLNEHLAVRGVLSHEARLIGFLRESSVLTEAERQKALGPLASSWLDVFDHRAAQRRVLGAQLVAAAAMALSFGGLELYRSQLEAREPTTVLGTRPEGTPNAGFLRVLARPWAEVSIDGVTVDTTPTSRRFPLTPGIHHVRLRNPTCVTEDRSVEVTPGALVWIDLDMVPLNEASDAR